MESKDKSRSSSSDKSKSCSKSSNNSANENKSLNNDKNFSSKSENTKKNNSKSMSDTTKSSSNTKPIIENKESTFNTDSTNVPITSTTFTSTNTTEFLDIPAESTDKIFDLDNNTVNELGFREKIPLSADFKPTDLQLEVFENGFSISCGNVHTRNDEIKTASAHQMRYSRFFDRPIRDVEFEGGEGIVFVYGDFADYPYPQ
ncbi:spore wall protein 8 [Vairimorpha apis BRL 01]|uniref:Spore wall protein 8 n=1 Tax=Vairimorpha apis BRL 01 TaxID=1037528 RepID=T0MFV5_9MICR|nr:spore wall protein 8 [Vairimorpha apis BRL 01]